MAVILYDDDFITEGLTIPPYASITKEYSVDRKFTIDIPPTNENIVKSIENYILLRNQTLTFNQQKNINGRNIGDYTCAISINGDEFYCLITLNTNSGKDTRFYDNGVWQKDGATLSLSIQEVLV